VIAPNFPPPRLPLHLGIGAVAFLLHHHHDVA
jgi:hypothetical protein